MNPGRLVIVPLIFALLTILSPFPATAQERVLHSFDGYDGNLPIGNVVFDAAGNLYGVTAQGGQYGYGTVFKLTPGQDGTWTESVLFTFHPYAPNNPQAGLAIDAAGNLYGTTFFGGFGLHVGFGTVFELSPASGGKYTEKILYQFSEDEGRPLSQPVFDAAGNMYGTCEAGVVWELTPNGDGTWTETVLHRFTGVDDGGDPTAGVTLDTAGNLYGTTQSGGEYKVGFVFKLTHTSNGWVETILHQFKAGSDGAYPDGALVLDAQGNVYGTTFGGGSPCGGFGCGTVFKLTPTGVGEWPITLLYSFSGNDDGGNPEAGMIFDRAGNLYGTTSFGGNFTCGSGCGTVFKLTPAGNGQWSESVLYDFPDAANGRFPDSPVVFGPAGDLYGTTNSGGSGFGVVYAVSASIPKLQ